MTGGISAGIRRALAAGRLSAVSAMVASSSWPREARALRDLGASAQTGLHVDLTHFPPLGPMPRFAPGDRPPGLRALIAGALRGTLPRQEIVDEIQRQLDRFEAEFGAPPQFVDGHQHAHALPGLRGALFAALRVRGATFGPWLRDPGDRWTRLVVRRVQVSKALAVASLTSGFAAQARARGFQCNEGFAGFSAFDESRDYAKDFARCLAAAGPRHLVMCHPGGDGPPAEPDSPHGAARARELDFLMSDQFSKLLIQLKISLSDRPMFTPS